MSSEPLPFSPAPPVDTISLRFQELEDKVQRAGRHEDLSLLRHAFRFASEKHGPQKRKSGEPYLSHPLEVAHLLADNGLDLVSVCTGLLHDVVEDTRVTTKEIEKEFGPEIARCVDGVTKLSRLGYQSSEARQAENFRKMLLAMVEDIRVMLVKLADRLHNMRTLRFLSPEKQQEIARETVEIYAPIALRLGMGKVRSELEDLAFCYLEPDMYREITRQIESRREASEEFLAGIKETVGKNLAEAGVETRIEGRIKRAYSIHQKLKRQGIAIDEVYDLLALRIITDSVKNCYAALGVIHQQWRPVPGRIKDFIAMPRPNLYQSLHTSVITDQGQTFEVQIRTEEMHAMAEEGICSHWKYKEGRSGADMDDRRMAWLRQLVEWQREVKDSSDFLSTLKIDLYPEEVYVFTPKGKLVVLPRGATPIDFAYGIHTEVGHTCVGAKVSSRIVPLKYQLRNGDIIEIITQQGNQPSPDWLSLVKTSRARNKIKQWLNAHRRQKAEEIGQKLLEKEARRLKIPMKKISAEAVRQICQDYGCSQPPDLFAALGYGRYSARAIAAKLAGGEAADGAAAENSQTASAKPAPVEPGALVVKGVDDILVYRARCCSPIRGEPIVGYVTRGKGVAVHSKNCPNVQNLMYEAERRIDVAWAQAEETTYRTRLQIFVDDRPGILNDLTGILSGESVNIVAVESRSDRTSPALIELRLEIRDVGQLERVMAAMRRIPDVREVTRSYRA
ncbi:MAG: bifunctional (p)ppGpp synthetase/guanosine-3',5'-bis(diphosphate) 3'-pyrophosphohydrolase [Bryobacterales bacterium]